MQQTQRTLQTQQAQAEIQAVLMESKQQDIDRLERDLATARSMVADIIEAEQAKTGENRSGMYYSLMSGSYKTGASFAIGIPYILLGAFVGFDPSGENSPEVVRGLMLVFVGVPVVSYALAAFILRNYKLTRAEQQANAEKLAAQTAP